MDKKFSARNRDKILKSLKYHIERNIPNYNGSTNNLRELVFENSRKIHGNNPELDIKTFNKHVLYQSFSTIKKSQNRNQTQNQTQNQNYNQNINNGIDPNMNPQNQPIFKMDKDEPLEDPMKELQRLQSSRDMMDNMLNPNRRNVENQTKSDDSSLINKILESVGNNAENEEEKKDEEPSGLESLFTTILPQNDTFSGNRNNRNIENKNQENQSIKSISIQDQTFRRRKTEQMDKDAITHSRPAKNREQELIIPRTIQQGYYDKEHTLVIYGLDRNWMNTDENRYNFNLKFQAKDSANTIRGQGTAKTDDTFRNIIGMQISSLILPNEKLNSITELTSRSVVDTSRPINALQYPYINVDIGSFNGEIQGTNQYIDRSFGNMKYDVAIKNKETNATDGFLAFIPTDKSQKRIFYPTPLANLKSMNISIRNPIGNLLSNDKDCIGVDKIYVANTDISAECPYGAALADLSNSIPYIVTSVSPSNVSTIGNLIIKTSTFFREGYINTGDIIQFSDITVPEDVSSLPAISGTLNTATKTAFETFINRKEGHYVVDIGHYDNTATDASGLSSLVSGGNPLGYANFIVIQLDYDDPTTGSITRKLFGSSETQDYLLHQHLTLYSQTGNPCLVNTSKQIEIVFKIFTRNYDGSELKPQNI
jgi:hypothetical protein